MSLITITRIISFRELFNGYNATFIPYGSIFYIHTKQVLTYTTTSQINREVNIVHSQTKMHKK